MRIELARNRATRCLSQKSLIENQGQYFWARTARVFPGEIREFAVEVANTSREDCQNVILGLVPGPHGVDPQSTVELWMYRVDQSGLPTDADRIYVGQFRTGDHFRLTIDRGKALLVSGIEMEIAANGFTPYYEYFNAPPAGANVEDIYVPSARVAPVYAIPNPLGQGGQNPQPVQRVAVS